jgi:hypothetical protein
MKLTLSTLLALALSGALLSGCDRPADKQATGKMGEAATGGTTGEKKQDPRTTPKQPGSPSTPSGSGGTK